MLIHGLAALRFVDYDRERKTCASKKVEKNGRPKQTGNRGFRQYYISKGRCKWMGRMQLNALIESK